MSRCDRFEREGLARLEQGLPPDEHFTTCPECRRARAGYERLREEIAVLGRHDDPPAHWQARVWTLIEERRQRRRPKGWSWFLLPAGVTAALAALFLAVPWPRQPAPLALELSVEAGSTVRRGAAARPGDRLALQAVIGEAPHAELRVYLNHRKLVLHCSTEPPCVRQGDTLRASLVLESIGDYQSLILAADRPLPPPSSDLDEDLAAAQAAGARFEFKELRVL